MSGQGNSKDLKELEEERKNKMFPVWAIILIVVLFVATIAIGCFLIVWNSQRGDPYWSHDWKENLQKLHNEYISCGDDIECIRKFASKISRGTDFSKLSDEKVIEYIDDYLLRVNG